MSANGKQGCADWAKIKAEYITSSVTAACLAEKYGVSASAIRKRCAAQHWQEQRKASKERASEKIAEKLSEDKVKQTVKEIDRVVSVAGRLITKLNRAVGELDKAEELVYSRIDESVNMREEKSDGASELKSTTEKNYNYRRERRKTLVDTKKAAEIAKSLLNVKEILTDYSAEQSDEMHLGIIEIPSMADMQPPKEVEENE